MFTLIAREIEDNHVFFIPAAIVAAIFSALFVYEQFYGDEIYKFLIGVGIVVLPIPSAIAFCAMGARNFCAPHRGRQPAHGTGHTACWNRHSGRVV